MELQITGTNLSNSDQLAWWNPLARHGMTRHCIKNIWPDASPKGKGILNRDLEIASVSGHFGIFKSHSL